MLKGIPPQRMLLTVIDADIGSQPWLFNELLHVSMQRRLKREETDQWFGVEDPRFTLGD